MLSADDVEMFLSALKVPVYRVLCTLLYATGLRLAEALALETRDIDAKRKVIHVRCGKGGKERFVMLSSRLYVVLRTYWAQERPPTPYLFANKETGQPISRDSVWRAMHSAAKDVGLEKHRVTPHLLRHSFATHLLENGTDPRTIADIVRAHRHELEQQHPLGPAQARVLTAIALCRTPALGGHREVCRSCGHESAAYNSCRNRHCPKCQALAQERWIASRAERLLPVRHFHVVFTLPSELRTLCRHAPRAIFWLALLCHAGL